MVDDNSYNLFAISHILNHLNLEVVTSLSGEEALQLVEKNKFDIILMDIQMPVMDGMETTKKLLEKFEMLEIRSPPIIALTANGEENKESYIRAGMIDMLMKPVKEHEIKKLLEKWA